MHLVILVWPTRVRMEARHKAATAIELPKEGRTVPSGRTRTAGDRLPFFHTTSCRTVLAVQGRYAAQNQRALDCSGPFHRLDRYERKGASEPRLGLVVAPPVGRRWRSILGWNSRLEKDIRLPRQKKLYKRGILMEVDFVDYESLQAQLTSANARRGCSIEVAFRR